MSAAERCSGCVSMPWPSPQKACAWSCTPGRLGDESTLIERWSTLGPRSNLRGEALRERMTNPSGIMQTLLGTLSRRVNRLITAAASGQALPVVLADRPCWAPSGDGGLQPSPDRWHTTISTRPSAHRNVDGQILPQDEALVGVRHPNPAPSRIDSADLHEIPRRITPSMPMPSITAGPWSYGKPHRNHRSPWSTWGRAQSPSPGPRR